MKKLNTCEVAIPANGMSAHVIAMPHTARNAKQELPEVRLPSVLLGRIVAMRESGEPLVDFPENTSGKVVPARSLVPISVTDAGREVALTFEDGDSSKPIIVGLLQVLQPTSTTQRDACPVDDELTEAQRRLEIEAPDEVVLRCGEASITLRQNGRVIIRGTYVESRSKGTNRIKGGVVAIN